MSYARLLVRRSIITIAIVAGVVLGWFVCEQDPRRIYTDEDQGIFGGMSNSRPEASLVRTSEVLAKVENILKKSRRHRFYQTIAAMACHKHIPALTMLTLCALKALGGTQSEALHVKGINGGSANGIAAIPEAIVFPFKVSRRFRVSARHRDSDFLVQDRSASMTVVHSASKP